MDCRRLILQLGRPIEFLWANLFESSSLEFVHRLDGNHKQMMAKWLGYTRLFKNRRWQQNPGQIRWASALFWHAYWNCWCRSPLGLIQSWNRIIYCWKSKPCIYPKLVTWAIKACFKRRHSIRNWRKYYQSYLQRRVWAWVHLQGIGSLLPLFSPKILT